MDTNKMANASFLDILFDGRNKEYGAYDLRKTYRRRLLIALVAMAAKAKPINAIANIGKPFKTAEYSSTTLATFAPNSWMFPNNVVNNAVITNPKIK